MTSRRRYLGVSLGILAILVLTGCRSGSPSISAPSSSASSSSIPSSSIPSSAEELTSSSQAVESSAEDIRSKLNLEGPFKWDAWSRDDLKKWGVIAQYGNELDSSCVVFVFNDVKSAQRVIDEKIEIWEAAGSSGMWAGKDSVSDLGIIFIAEELDAACSQSVIKVLNWNRTSTYGFD